jgi:ubiquinone/menaquinone biosynthesis C-methylase UbiE
MDPQKTRQTVQRTYGRIALKGESCCAPQGNTALRCCSGETRSEVALVLGYSRAELTAAPEASNLSLGCGNPLAIASLREGETVLDLGSGAGFDSLLAGQRVGPNGRVIGVDMTPQMLARARRNAESVNAQNVEFRLGEIEHLPLPDASVDVIISNCVINLSPEKPQVFREAFRVLKPGGRLAIADIVACIPLPQHFREDAALVSSCVGGVATIGELQQMLAEAGFEHILILPKAESKTIIKQWSPELKLEDIIVSATIEAVKPSANT